jgi:hypothetical protein
MKTFATKSPAQPWEEMVQQYVGSVRFGVVQIIIHDGRVVQVERTERVRFDGPESKIKSEDV